MADDDLDLIALYRKMAPAKYARAEAHGCYKEWPDEAPSICTTCCLPPQADPLAALLEKHQYDVRVNPSCACGWNSQDERWGDWMAWVHAEKLSSMESIQAWIVMRRRYHAEHVAELVVEHLAEQLLLERTNAPMT